ncbi:MAG TPA: glycoside hydrolase family 6 protein, partial [Pseudonocardiaceae bacterium]
MRRLLVLPLTALLVCATAMTATAGPARPSESRLFVPPPTPAAITQIEKLAKAGDRHDARLLAEMVTTPQAVWLTSGTPAQAQTQVQTTMAAAARQRAVPTFVAYDIPGRDCAQFSAGG